MQMPGKSSNNPFLTQIGPVPVQKFIGYSEFIKSIYTEIRANSCISLVGTPHIGMSSMMMFLCSSLGKSTAPYDLSTYIFVYLDFNLYTQTGREVFFTEVCHKIVEQ